MAYHPHMPYPVTLSVEPALTNRNRLTTAFRLILAIPHILLVGGAGFSVALGSNRGGMTSVGTQGGLLGLVAWILAIVSWFTILVTGGHNDSIRQYTKFYLRWRVRGLAYLMLLEDPYPPFGDEPYPTSLTIADPEKRDRLSVAFRLFLLIPHFIVLIFVMIAWSITAIIAWFIILFTGAYPKSLFDFGVGALRWLVRVETYALLMVDEYPPFSST